MRKTRTHRLIDSALKRVAPPPRMDVLEWAEANRRLTDGVSAIEGPFRALPYQRFLLQAVGDRRYSEHCWMIAAQTVKTESINCVIGYFIDQDPCAIMVVYPTLEMAKVYSKKKLSALIRSTESLKGKVLAARSRDSGNTILSKDFPGGDIVIVGSNAPGMLRGTSRRVVIQDEIDSYEASAGSEGDPCVLADMRAENFPNAVFIKASTPTVKGMSRIENKFETSTKHRYHVPCPKCGHRQWLKWDRVRWLPDQPESAWYECEAAECDAQWSDQDRIRAIHAGEWVAEHPERRRLGAQLSALYRLIGLKDTFSNYLHEFASNFIDRKRAGKMALRAWTNTFLAETFEEETEHLNPNTIAYRAERYEPTAIPEGVLVMTAGADVQKNRLEVTAFGWGIDEECWSIQKVVIHGEPEKDEVWQKLDGFLLREYKREDGLPLKIERAFIDQKYARFQMRVLNFCRPRLARGVYPCMGVNRVGIAVPPLLPPKPNTNNKARVPQWPVGVTVAKNMIYDRLALPVGEPRSVHFGSPAAGFDEDHFKQLTSEVRRTRYSHGQPYFIFEKVNDSVRNEALDMFVYGLAALHSLGPINWVKLADNRAAALAEIAQPVARLDRDNPPLPEPLHQTPAAVVSPNPRRHVPRVGGNSWVTGGRW